jgi:uncharacterized protein YjaG (DUF416 family)
MYRFDKQNMLVVLSRLPPQALVAFAASCASRLAPGYKVSQEYLKEGDPKIVERALDELWLFATRGETADWELVSDHLVELIPDEEAGSTFAHGVIDDALASAAYAARAALGAAPLDALLSAKRAYETVDRFAGLTINATDFTDAVEALILENAVVQDELGRQMRDLGNLDVTSARDLQRVVEDLRQRSSQVSTLPLDDVRRHAIMATAK